GSCESWNISSLEAGDFLTSFNIFCISSLDDPAAWILSIASTSNSGLSDGDLVILDEDEAVDGDLL
nr:hypothetical protein [Tanacetum cinerariifolium]